MTDRPILAVVDPKTAPAVIAAARRQAERRGLGLEVLGVIEPPRDPRAAAAAAGLSPDALLDQLTAAFKREIETALPGEAPVTVRCGKAFIEIILHAVSVRAALVIKAPEPFTGARLRLFASTDQHLLRKCPCPVWLLPEGGAPEVRTVVAAVDVDPEAAEPETLADVNARVIEAAYAVCEPDGEIHLLHAWQAEDEGLFRAFGGDGERAAQAYADAVKAGRRRALDAFADAHPPPEPGPRVIKRLMRGAAHTVIAEAARRVRADVLVM
ncbi:MAG: universal stress protein, partial [Oceanicaulis sp.]